MPFITEELWQRLRVHTAPSSIMVCEYPSMMQCCWKNEKVEKKMDNVVMLVVNSLRSLAKESRERRPAFVLSRMQKERELIYSQRVIINKLANAMCHRWR